MNAFRSSASYFGRRLPARAAVALAVCLGGIAAVRGEDAPPSGPAAAADELVRFLRDHGAPAPDAADAARGAMEAALKTRDPGARVGAAIQIGEMEAARAGQVYGIGLKLIETNTLIEVVQVESESPAAAAGVLPGDVLESLDNRYVAGRTLVDVRAALQKPAGVSILLTVMRPGEKQVRTFELMPRPLAGVLLERVELWPRGIGYIRPGAVRAGVAEALRTAVNGWRDRACVGVILDIRGIGGDSVEDVRTLALALGAKAAPRWELLEGESEPGPAPEAESVPALGLPVVLLVDGNTRGAAEGLAAAVRGQSTVLVLGAPTAGDPLLRQVLELGPDCQAWVATRRLRFPDGRDVGAGEPVMPDLPLSVAQGIGSAPIGEEEDDFGNRHRKELGIEETDRQLAARIGTDAVVRQAADVLLALRALSGMAVPARDAVPAG